MSASLQSLKYSRGSLEVIDQLLLPHELVYVKVENCNDAWAVIRSMQVRHCYVKRVPHSYTLDMYKSLCEKVRGAPLIAITAAMALAVEAHKMAASPTESMEKVCAYFLERLTYLRTSRPTAVNLFIAADEFEELVKGKQAEVTATVPGLLKAIIDAAEAMLKLDVATNKSIGAHGAKRILELVGQDKIRVLTICNTGSLATAGYGTALGRVVYSVQCVIYRIHYTLIHSCTHILIYSYTHTLIHSYTHTLIPANSNPFPGRTYFNVFNTSVSFSLVW